MGYGAGSRGTGRESGSGNATGDRAVTAEHLHLKVDIDRELAAQITVAAITHGTSVAEEVNAALTEWLRPLPEETDELATVLQFESRGA